MPPDKLSSLYKTLTITSIPLFYKNISTIIYHLFFMTTVNEERPSIRTDT